MTDKFNKLHDSILSEGTVIRALKGAMSGAIQGAADAMSGGKEIKSQTRLLQKKLSLKNNLARKLAKQDIIVIKLEKKLAATKGDEKKLTKLKDAIQKETVKLAAIEQSLDKAINDLEQYGLEHF